MQVGVYDGANNLKSGGSPVTISLAIGTNPGGGTLVRHDRHAATSAGIATFADLSIDQPGDGYTLVASAAGSAPSTSDPFNIAGLVQGSAMPGVDCIGNLSDGRHRRDRERPGRPVGAGAHHVAHAAALGLDCDGYDGAVERP